MLTDDLYLLIATIASAWFLLLTLLNIFHLRRSRRVPLDSAGPHVTVIVPARDEEANIGACVESLLGQDYEHYDIVVVDDNSDDGTREIVADLALTDSRLTLIDGAPVPASWNGKQFACHQAVQVARGELLLMTDADVRHNGTSINRAVAQLQKRNASFLSGYVQQEVGTVGEALIVPMSYMMSTLLLPLRLLATKLFPAWGFAIGQYMLIRRETLDSVGGYEGLKDSLVEDMALSRAVRASGARTVFVDARESATCRMYHGYVDAFRGFAKSVFGAVGGKAWVILLLIAMVWLAVVHPYYQWVTDIATGGLSYYPTFVPVLLFTLMWTLALRDRGTRAVFGLFYPISYANLILIALVSMLRTGFGRGVLWKGRLVRCGRPDYPDPDILNAVTLYRFFSTIVYTLVFTVVVIYNKIAFGLVIHGRHNLHGIDGGYFLISNHTLYLDPGVIAHAIFPKRTYFSAMAQTFERPFLGGFIRLLGAFPLPEKATFQRIIPAIEWALRRGRCVHFFPEGELSHRSQDPAEFHAGVFYLANRFDVPVVPVTLVIEDRYLLGMRLGGPFIRVTVVIGEPVRATENGETLAESGVSPKIAANRMALEAREQMKQSIRSIVH